MKVIKGESEVFDLLKMNVKLFGYDTPLGYPGDEQQVDDSNIRDPEIYEKMLVRLIDVTMEQWLELKYSDQSTIINKIKENVIATWLKREDDEEVMTNEEPYNLGEENTSERYEVAEICKIEVGLFEFKTPICDAFKERNYLSQVDVDVLTKDIPVFKTYEEYKDDWIYEWNNGIPWANEKPWTDDGE
ncbi:hypothetical protein Tco_1387239 [Tanacetum coccineum]